MNTIILSECLEHLASVEDDFFDVSLTSPPYNRKRNDKYKNYTDKIDDYFSFLVGFTDELLRVSKGFVFVNIQKNLYNKTEVLKYIGHYADKTSEIIIWNKANPMPASADAITNAYEFFICLHPTGDALKSNHTYTQNTFQTAVYSQNEFKGTHDAVMHPEACNFILHNFVKKGALVLDPFSGTGTTPICCILLSGKYSVCRCGLILAHLRWGADR